jgi:hypothetical protein
MSSYTYFTLQFSHPSRQYLEEAREYMREKRKRWHEWHSGGGDPKVLLKKIGAKRSNEIMSWGFKFGEITEEKEGFVLHATARAKQDDGLLHMTGKKGELADILSKFPDLRIDGVFKDDDGGGTVHQTEQKYQYMGEEGDETVMDMEPILRRHERCSRNL